MGNKTFGKSATKADKKASKLMRKQRKSSRGKLWVGN